MKRLILFLTVVLCFAVNGQSKRLLYLFQEPVIKYVYAVNMNGSDEYMYNSSTTPFNLGSSSVTILAWIKPSNITGAKRIVSVRNTFTYELIQNNGLIEGYLNDGSGTSFNTGASNVTANKWALAFIEIDQGVDSVRVGFVNENGLTIFSNSRSITDFNTNAGLTIGRYPTVATQYFSGLLGEVILIKDKALTRSELIQQYNLGAGGDHFSISGGTIMAWYKWEGATNTDFLNDAGSGNNDLTGSNVTQSDDQTTITGGYK